MTTTQIVIVILFSAAGAIVQGSVGIGLSLVAGPALIAIDGGFAPGPLLLAGQIVGVRHIIVEHRHLDREACAHTYWGLPVGLCAGLIVLEKVSDRTMAILIGALTVLAAIALLSGASVARTRKVEIAAGVACAFSSITAGLPGPPLVLAYNDMKPATLRATAASYVIAVAAVGFVLLVLTGNFGRHELTLTAWLIPGVVTGLVLARWVRPYLDRSWFRPLVLGIALIGGLALIGRQF